MRQSTVALTDQQRTRYARNLLIPGFGEAGQERLNAASACIVGLGGLGSAAGLYLAAAGIGRLGLLDWDTIELSNLQRQVLHPSARIGRLKTDSAAETLAALNPEVRLERLSARLTPDNADGLLGPFETIIEATDNFEAKFLINDVCLTLRKPFATAGILSLSGQAMFVVPGQTACLRCALPDVPDGVPTTSQQGVLGAVPGILGSLQAMEVIRWIVGLWKPRPRGAGLLHSVDGQAMRLQTIETPPRLDCRCAPLWNKQ